MFYTPLFEARDPGSRLGHGKTCRSRARGASRQDRLRTGEGRATLGCPETFHPGCLPARERAKDPNGRTTRALPARRANSHEKTGPRGDPRNAAHRLTNCGHEASETRRRERSTTGRSVGEVAIA